MPISSKAPIGSDRVLLPNAPFLVPSISLKSGAKNYMRNSGLPFKKRHYVENGPTNNKNCNKDSNSNYLCQKISIPNGHPLNDVAPVDFSLPTRIRAGRGCKPKATKIGSIIDAMWAKAGEKEVDDGRLPLDLRGVKKFKVDKSGGNEFFLHDRKEKHLMETNDSSSCALLSAYVANLAQCGLRLEHQDTLPAPIFEPMLYSAFSRLLLAQQLTATATCEARPSPTVIATNFDGFSRSGHPSGPPPLKRTRFQPHDDVKGKIVANSPHADYSSSTTSLIMTSSTPSPKSSSSDGLSAVTGLTEPCHGCGSGSESGSANENGECYVINPVTGNKVRRTYKNMTVERRIEANARERDRVHTIGTAFDDLRKKLPTQKGGDQKISKLSILRIACSYILLLASMSGRDYSAGCQGYSVRECFEMVAETLSNESKCKK